MTMKGRSPEARRLYRMAVGGTNPHVLAEANSNDFSATNAVLRASLEFNRMFDFGGNAYWVRVEFWIAQTPAKSSSSIP